MENHWELLSAGLVPIRPEDLIGIQLAHENGATLVHSGQDYLWYKKASNKVSEISYLGEILKSLDDVSLECDGLTRVISLILLKSGISHHIITGTVEKTDGSARIQPHLWIVLENGKYIDFRARMWLGNDESIPHGHFHPSNFPSVKYNDLTINLPAADPFANILAVINNIDVSKISQHIQSSVGTNTT